MAKHKQYIYIIFLYIVSTVLSQCLDQPPPLQTILETDEPGYYLFNLTSATDEWSFDIVTPATPDDFFTSYFNFDLHNETYIFSINKTLDLEDIHNKTNIILMSFQFRFSCTIKNRQTQKFDYFLKVVEVNEFPPNFINPPFIRNVNEDVVINTPLIKLIEHAEDKDINQTMTEIQGFKIHDYIINVQIDGQQKFGMPRSQDGLIVLTSSLDYETMQQKFYILNVSVHDRGGLTDFTLVTVNVIDVDDQPPEFYYNGCQTTPCSIFYKTSIEDSFLGELNNLSPASIFARDRDSLNYSIRYSITNGDIPNIKEYFVIDDVTGVVTVIRDFQDIDVSSFSLTIKAEEVSANRHSTSTFLWVTILGRSTDSQPTQVVTQLIQSEESTLKYAMIGLGVVIFLIIVAFILSIIFVRKKYRKPISPIDLSPAGSEIGTEDEEVSMSGSDNWPSPIPPGKQERIIASLPEGRGSLPPIQYVETGQPPSQYQMNLNQVTLQRSSSKKSHKRHGTSTPDIYDGTREYEGPANLDFFTQEKSKYRLSSKAKARNNELDHRYWITVDNTY